MPPGRQTWLYHKEELENTPSRREGMPQEEERAVRKSTCQFIQKVATNTRIQCKPLAVWTAKVYFHRVCMTQSIAKEGQHPKLIGVTCLFLACKVEEDLHPIREFIWAMNKIDVDDEGKHLYPYGTREDRAPDKHGRPQEMWMVDDNTEMYQRVRENIMSFERILLHVLDFDFQVRHPMQHIQDMIKFMDVRRKKNADNTGYEETRRLVDGDEHNSVLTDLGTQIQHTALAMANDSYSTTLLLQYDAAVIAAGCVSLAIKAVTQANQYKLIKMSKWVKELVGYWNAKDDQDLKQAAGNLKKEQIEDVHTQMLDLYDGVQQADHKSSAISSQACPPADDKPAATAATSAKGNESKALAPRPVGAAASPAMMQEDKGHTDTPPVSVRVPATSGSGPLNGAHKPPGHSSEAPAGPPPSHAADRRLQDLADLEAGKVVQHKGSTGSRVYELKYNKETNVYSCTCTVWNHVPVRNNEKTCYHLCKVRGEETETGRVGEEGIAKMKKAFAELSQKPAARPRPEGSQAHGHDAAAAKRQRFGP